MYIARGIAQSVGALGGVIANLRFLIAHGASYINVISLFDEESLVLKSCQFGLHCDFPDFGSPP